MGRTLIELVERSGAQVISVVGLAKNTGKTTTLLYLLRHLEAGTGGLALTSTGRDGEAVDEITRRQKPRVSIGRGTLATTGERSVPEGDGLSVVSETPYITATGRIIVVRADRTSRVVLEGPATAAEMGRLVTDLLEREGVRRVIIDGSLDRVAAAAPGISEGVILATGAILGPDITAAVDKTRHAARLFKTRRSGTAAPERFDVSRYCAVSADGSTWEMCEGSAITDFGSVAEMLAKGGRYLFISGALSDGVLTALMERRLYPVVIVRDATRIFVTERTAALFAAGGGVIQVERTIDLIALTVNPHNPEGVDFDPDDFLAEMRRALPDVPIFDIVREETGGIETRA
jgi:hypothetical protein